jgi:hypothetical protein
MTTDLSQASAVEALGDGRFRGVVPDGWQQGRGAFGGLVLALLLRAIERSEPDSARSTRTLTGDLCGPVLPGPVEIVVETLRRGNNLSNLDARLIQSGEVQARASAVLSVPRVSVDTPTRARPATPGWDTLHAVDMGPPIAPVFTAHFEYRPASEMFADPEGTRGWLRPRTPLDRLDGPALVAMLDAWWPAIFAVEGRPRIVATVSFTAELLRPLGSLRADLPLLHIGRVAAVSEGFFVEFRELWQGEQLVAMNQQTFAILK